MSSEHILPQELIDQFYKEIDAPAKKKKEIAKAKHSPKPVRTDYTIGSRKLLHITCPICGIGISEVSLLFTQNKSPIHIAHCNFCDETVSISMDLFKNLKKQK